MSKRAPTHLSVRNLSPDLLARIDALLEHVAPSGVRISRSDVVRAALTRGLSELERDARAGVSVLRREEVGRKSA